MDFFSISKLGWLLVQPVSAVLIGMVLTALLLWWGRSVVAHRLLLAMIFGYGLVMFSNIGQLMLLPLENHYPKPSFEVAEQVAGIIVLGGGFDGRVTRMRGGYALGEAGDRFTEAVTLGRRYLNVPIIVSGGDASFIGTTEGDAAIAPRFFAAMGIDERRVFLESQSRNTHQNAIFTADFISNGRFERSGRWILVTSAFHMRRAMESFALTDLALIAWPVDYRTAGDETFSFGRDDLLRSFSEFNLAVREWIGIVVYRATNKAASP